MKHKDKYQAAKAFERGYLLALTCRGETDWECPLFRSGYECGRIQKKSFTDHRNIALRVNGFEPIMTVELAKQEV